MWKPGEIIVWRGLYRGKIWYAIPVYVVKDAPHELVLAIVPGAVCKVETHYGREKANGKRIWDFEEIDWTLKDFTWHTNRVLLILEPQRYYSINLFWNYQENEFIGYYINFQQPYQRFHSGIDARDLELDIDIEPDLSFRWKDVEDYRKAIDHRVISAESVQEIQAAKPEVLARLEKRQYPFDGSWLDWMPDPAWTPPALPENWDRIYRRIQDRMTKTWKSGDVVALRGIYDQRVLYMQSAIVVRDHPDEVALAILPGAECCAPEGYMTGKHGLTGGWDRWGEYQKGFWNMQGYAWHTNRVLILLHPENYYASYYFWRADNNEFLCYYLNFQLPFHRTEIGFDSFDLELDLIIEPTYEWHWKDVEDYQRGIECGILRREWVQAIEAAKPEVFKKLEKRQYPFDSAWLNWMPDPAWTPPALPENWDKI